MPEELLRNIYRIPITLPGSPLKAVNSYLIRGAERNLLIDTGFNHPDCETAMRSALSELGTDLNHTDILLTHLHSDHSGLAASIATPETRIFLPRVELPRILWEMRTPLWQEDIERMVGLGFPRAVAEDELTFSTSYAMAADPAFSRYLPLDEGDEFICGDYRVKAVSTPGHTPGHMCFWMEEQQILFTGDCILFDITPNITSWQEMEDALGTYLASLKRLDSFDVRFALPAHRTSGEFHARIKALIAHHEARLEECYDVVKANSGASVYELASKMTWKMRCNSWNDFPPFQKWFAVGECYSHLQRLEVLGRVKKEDGKLVRYSAAEAAPHIGG